MVTPLMTWNVKQARWFIKYRKKQYTVSPGALKTAPTKEASAKAANDWWEAKKQELDKQVTHKPAILPPLSPEEVDRLRAIHPGITDSELAPVIREEQEAREAQRLRTKAFWAEADAADRLYAAHKRKVQAGATVAANVKDFLETKKRSITLNEVTKDRWDSLRTSLEQFRDWIGGETHLESIDEETLVRYRNHLIDKVDVGNLSTYTARDRLDSVRQFLRDRWQLHKLENLPRNVDSRDLPITAHPAKVRTFTVEEVKTLLKDASERTRLYLLLMLNLGYLQTDISELRHEDVDWKQGFVEKKRHKTERYKHVPTVRYKLWTETFDLLKKHQSSDPERVLVTEDGKPLKQSRIKANGKLHKTSAITEAWKRLAKKTNTMKPVKLIRKTAADLLDGHQEHGRYSLHFLGHSSRSVALKHYITPKQNQFDAAVKWLGEQFGVKV